MPSAGVLFALFYFDKCFLFSKVAYYIVIFRNKLPQSYQKFTVEKLVL